MSLDDRIIHVDQGEPEEAAELAAALEIEIVLHRHYPHHPWQVEFSGGALRIRHRLIADAWIMATGRDGCGVLLPRNLQKAHYHELARQAVHGAGEHLEMFGLPRGPWDGRAPIIPPRMAMAARLGKTGRDLIG